MSYRDIDLDKPAPRAFRIRARLRRSALVRWFYRRRWNRTAVVLLVSFPKAGRTWLRVLLGKALSLHFGGADENLIELQKLSDANPEIPRIKPKHDDNPHLKTPGELVTSKSEYADRKVILMVRDIRDLAVSTYFQMTRRENRFQGDITRFLRLQRGSVDTMIRFYNIWAENRDIPADFLLVRYEDLHADPHSQLRRVLEFVGVEQVSDETISSAVEFASFENMRKMEAADSLGSERMRPKDQSDPESFKTRRGKVGGYVDYLNPQDIEMLDRRIARELSPMYYGDSVGAPAREKAG